VLIAGSGSLASLVGGFNPVPAAVAMPAQAPSVAQAALVGRAASETDHHAGCAASLAERSRVIHSWRGLIPAAIELVPAEGRSLDTEAPNVIDGLCASVTAVNE